MSNPTHADAKASPITPTERLRIVLATPHARYNALERALRAQPDLDVMRIRTREQLTLDALRQFGADYVFFPHWSWKVPSEVFQQFECVIFHMTDVPFGRGGSPLQNLIVRKVEQTQLSALRCAEELDAGPVYLKRPLATLGSAEEVFVRAAALMEQMIVDIVRGNVKPVPQSGTVVQFERRKPEQSDMKDACSLEDVFDLIRMLDADGYPHAFVEVGDLRLEFTRASRRGDHVLADVRITLKSNDA